MIHDDDPTVFSIGPGGSSSSRKPARRDEEKARTAAGAGDGAVRVRRETAGRGGKTVTTIAGFRVGRLRDPPKLGACGSGNGQDGVIEIQGDHRDRILPLLESKGYRVKRAGG
jgi:translation initiation factor 1